jgi:hypothetical protein
VRLGAARSGEARRRGLRAPRCSLISITGLSESDGSGLPLNGWNWAPGLAPACCLTPSRSHTCSDAVFPFSFSAFYHQPTPTKKCESVREKSRSITKGPSDWALTQLNMPHIPSLAGFTIWHMLEPASDGALTHCWLASRCLTVLTFLTVVPRLRSSGTPPDCGRSSGMSRAEPADRLGKDEGLIRVTTQRVGPLRTKP